MHTCRIYGLVIMMLMVMMLMVSMRIVRVCRPGGYPGWSAQCWLRPRGRARLEAFSRPSCGCGHSHFDQRCWEREVWLSHFDISRCWEREVFGILVLISRWWKSKVFCILLMMKSIEKGNYFYIDEILVFSIMVFFIISWATALR